MTLYVIWKDELSYFTLKSTKTLTTVGILK